MSDGMMVLQFVYVLKGIDIQHHFLISVLAV